MGTFNDISNLFHDIADVIRTKTGSTKYIRGNDFAREIEKLDIINTNEIESRVITYPESTGTTYITTSEISIVENRSGESFPGTLPGAVTAYNSTSNFAGVKEIRINSVKGSSGNIRSFFYNFKMLNVPVTFSSAETNLEYAFGSCTNFNQPITIPENVTVVTNMFHSCTNFNQPITIPENVTNVTNMFYNCASFNQPITFPNGVSSIRGALDGCTNFNQPIHIKSTTNAGLLLRGCTSFGSSVYFTNPPTYPSSTTGMFCNCNRMLIKSVYCNNAEKMINYTNNQSIVSNNIRWFEMEDGNGYFNFYYNVYIYNNYNP